MNRFFCIIAALSIFYLIQQPDLVASSSGGSYGGGGGASKLNLGNFGVASLNSLAKLIANYLFQVSGFHR